MLFASGATATAGQFSRTELQISEAFLSSFERFRQPCNNVDTAPKWHGERDERCSCDVSVGKQVPWCKCVSSVKRSSKRAVESELLSPSRLPLEHNLTSYQAVVEDLDPPPALSVSPLTPISNALLSAFERDYTHLTVVDPENRSLLGYLSIPRLKGLLKDGTVAESDPVEKAMNKFRRRGRRYRVITMETPLEELEAFFEGKLIGGEGNGSSEGRSMGEKQEFAVVTDGGRRFVLGVATRGDLEEFVKRRP